jgi:hypothetical protein
MSAILIRYDAMCSAIAAAHAVDEVKDIRDKALAIEMYARQAKNTEAETRACEIRLRAERRAGQMLAEMEKAKGGRPAENPSRSVTGFPKQTLDDLGISRPQSSRWQKLASIPEEDFEATLVKPDKKPSTSGIIEAHQQKTQPSAEPRAERPVELCRNQPGVNDRALWLWGRLLDFERDGLLGVDPNALCATMLQHMKETTRELAPVVATWLGRITG